jgi:hypothetical protein
MNRPFILFIKDSQARELDEAFTLLEGNAPNGQGAGEMIELRWRGSLFLEAKITRDQRGVEPLHPPPKHPSGASLASIIAGSFSALVQLRSEPLTEHTDSFARSCYELVVSSKNDAIECGLEPNYEWMLPILDNLASEFREHF